MRVIYIVLSGLGCLIVVINWGLALSMSLAAVLMVVYFLIDRKLTLSEWGKMIDNVYISSQHENDQYVEQRARDAEELLRVSGNQTQVKVLRFFFQDAEYRNETWEEFTQRVAKATEEDRLARHKWLNENRDKYLRHALNQKIKN